MGFKKKKYSILPDDASVALCEKNQKRKKILCQGRKLKIGLCNLFTFLFFSLVNAFFYAINTLRDLS